MKVEKFINKAKYDPDGQIIWAVDENNGLQKILDVRGWGAIQNRFSTGNTIDLKAAAKFQDELGEFIAEAINEKIKASS